MSRETSASVRPTRGISPADELGRHPVGGGRRPAQGVDLAASLTARRGDGDARRRQPRSSRAGRPGGGGRTWPTCGRRPPAGWRPATDQVGHQGHRVLGLVPRPDAEEVGVGLDPRRLQPGHDERGVAVDGQHEHGEPLERHGLVAGEPRQVGAQREQQDVDLRARPSGPAPARCGRARADSSMSTGYGSAASPRSRSSAACGRRPSGSRTGSRRCARPGGRGWRRPACWRRRRRPPPGRPWGRRWWPRSRSRSGVVPTGMARSACQTRCWKAVPRTSRGRSRPTRGSSTRATTADIHRSKPASAPVRDAVGNRSSRSWTRASGSSPREMAHTPASVAATRTDPREHSPTPKRMVGAVAAGPEVGRRHPEGGRRRGVEAAVGVEPGVVDGLGDGAAGPAASRSRTRRLRTAVA